MTRGCIVKDKLTGKVLIQGVQNEGLYIIQGAPTRSSFLTEKVNKSSEKELWHRRLGHPSEKVLNEVFKCCKMSNLINKENLFCDACQLGKLHALPFKKSEANAENPP